MQATNGLCRKWRRRSRRTRRRTGIPHWSPDGRQIAFFSFRGGNRDIWVMPLLGGPARPLAAHPARDWAPAWSPSGDEIAFESRRGGDSAIWIMKADGCEPRKVAAAPAPVAWSPDGTWLVVRRDNRLYRVVREGGELIEIGAGGTPLFSHDGRALYYSVFSGPRAGRDIWKRSLDDGRVSRVTQLADRRGYLGYAFAVDPQFVYFTWGENEGDIGVMDVTPAAVP